MRHTIIAALLTLATIVSAHAQGSITVVKAWSRATAPGTSVGAAYFDIVNLGAADVLTAIETPRAQRVQMHSMTVVNGLMQMRQLESLPIPAKGHVVFEPNSLHAVLIDLTGPLKAGETVPLILSFRGAGKIEVDALVQGPGAAEPPAQPPTHVAPPTATPGVVHPSANDYRMATWPMHAGSPDFSLVDADGQQRTLADYRGRVVILFFGFVHCPEACPAELFKLGLVMKRLGQSADRVQVLFVTLDPERDTRQRLKTYLSAYDPRFIGLTGSTTQIDRAAANFYVEYARVSTGADYTIDHSTSTFVLDTGGRLRLIGNLKTTVDDFAHDLAALARESG
jgi:protein SCO1